SSRCRDHCSAHKRCNNALEPSCHRLFSGASTDPVDGGNRTVRSRGEDRSAGHKHRHRFDAGEAEKRRGNRGTRNGERGARNEIRGAGNEERAPKRENHHPSFLVPRSAPPPLPLAPPICSSRLTCSMSYPLEISALQSDIRALATDRNAVILAHNY